MAKMTDVILPENSVSSTGGDSLLQPSEKTEDPPQDPEAVEESQSLEEKKDHVSDLAMQTMEVQENLTTNADSKCF